MHDLRPPFIHPFRRESGKFCPGRNWWLVNDPMFSRAFHSQHFKSTSNPILRSFHVSHLFSVGEKWRRRKATWKDRSLQFTRAKFLGCATRSYELSYTPTIFPRAGKISFRSDKSKKKTILFLICVFCQIVYKNIFLFSHFFFFLRKQREEEIETSIERFANFYRRNRET